MRCFLAAHDLYMGAGNSDYDDRKPKEMVRYERANMPKMRGTNTCRRSLLRSVRRKAEENMPSMRSKRCWRGLVLQCMRTSLFGEKERKLCFQRGWEERRESKAVIHTDIPEMVVLDSADSTHSGAPFSGDDGFGKYESF